MSTILRQIRTAGCVEVMDAGPVRDFLWVEDAAEAIVALALSDIGQGNNQRVFNLGTGIGTSIGALARLALEITGQPNRQVNSKCPSSRQSSLIVDISDATFACGWRPKISLRQGLTHLLNSMEEDQCINA